MKRAWNVVFYIFRLFDKFVTLPIQYNPQTQLFFSSRASKLYGWYLGCFGVFVFLFTVIYRLLCELYFPHRNLDLGFDLKADFSYLLCFLVCSQSAVCIWTCQVEREIVVVILNTLMDMSRKHNNYYPGDRINFMWFKTDTGATVNIIASVGFMAYPVLACVLPIVSQSDPASHIARTIIPGRSHLEQTLLAAFLQGSVCAFGAMPCLQILQMLTVMVVEFCGAMGEATTIHNPWVALQLQRLNNVHGHMMKWGKLKNKSIKDRILIGNHKLVKSATVKPATPIITPMRPFKEENPEQVEIEISPPQLRTFMVERINRMRKRKQILLRWKCAVYKVVCFRPSLMLHRQMIILNSVAGGALQLYIPTLILVGICLIVCCIFFPIRFDPPVMVTIPCMVIALSVTAIIGFLLPAVSLVSKVSKRYTRFWKQRLRTPLNRKQLRSCRHMAVGLGPFTNFYEDTLLLVLHIIFNLLGTLLINF